MIVDTNAVVLRVQQDIYTPLGLVIHAFQKEAESQEYGACTFMLHNKFILFRVAKITPTKIGQFVTVWKRMSNDGPIMPYDEVDRIDFFVVTVMNGYRFGQFVFPKHVLVQRGVFSQRGVGGKRAMRVYPAWDRPDSQQARKTQEWQKKYFFEINTDGSFDNTFVKNLFL